MVSALPLAEALVVVPVEADPLMLGERVADEDEDGLVDDGLVADEPLDDGLVEDGLVEDGLVADELLDDGLVEEELLEGDFVEDDGDWLLWAVTANGKEAATAIRARLRIRIFMSRIVVLIFRDPCGF